MRDGMRVGRVYIHRYSRENAMSFVHSLATMIVDVMDNVLRRNGVDMTFEKVVNDLFSLNLKYDRELEEESFSGPSELADLFMDVAEALGIDTDHLIH